MKKCYYALILLGFILSFGFGQLSANDEIEKVREKLPKMLGASNIATDYWITFNPCWETSGSINDVRVFVSSSVRTLVTLEIPGKNYYKTQYTVPNDVIEFRIPTSIAQCYQKTDTQEPKEDQVFIGAGVHISAAAPIVVYGLTRIEYTSDGFMAIPVSSLGKEYIVASYADPTSNVSQWLPSEVGIVACYDNTKVTFTMGGSIYSKTVSGLKPGESKEYSMNQGDVLLFAGSGAYADLSGSKIVSSKPVAVVSGNFCAYIPSDKGYCDFISEMEIPTFTWGKDYHVTPIYTRRKNSIIKIFAKEENTTIYRDGIAIGTISTAGGTEGSGYLHLRADDGEPRAIVISGDKPINVTQFNPGQEDDGVTSDPFQLVLTPIEQYQTEIVFNTPGILGGYGFPDNYINICYEANSDGSVPEDLQFAKVENGTYTWTTIKDIDSSLGKKFAYDVNNKTYYSKTLLLPSDGVYKIKADNPFAVYSYGFSNYDSYGFPASLLLADTHNDISCPVPKWEQNADGDVTVAEVRDYPDDESLRSNLSLILFDEENSNNYKFNCDKFIPGEFNTVSWDLSVIDKSKDAKAFITFCDRKGNDTTIAIEYKAPVGVNENKDVNGFSFKEISPNPVGVNGADLEFTIGTSSNTVIGIYDESGKLISQPVASMLQAGSYSEQLQVNNLPNGTYICVMTSGKFKQIRKFTVVK